MLAKPRRGVVQNPAPSQSIQLKRTLGRRIIVPRRSNSAHLHRLWRACAYRKSNPAVVMMQSAQDRQTENAPNRLDTARDWRVLVQ